MSATTNPKEMYENAQHLVIDFSKIPAEKRVAVLKKMMEICYNAPFSGNYFLLDSLRHPDAEETQSLEEALGAENVTRFSREYVNNDDVINLWVLRHLAQPLAMRLSSQDAGLNVLQ